MRRMSSLSNSTISFSVERSTRKAGEPGGGGGGGAAAEPVLGGGGWQHPKSGTHLGKLILNIIINILPAGPGPVSVAQIPSTDIHSLATPYIPGPALYKPPDNTMQCVY